MSPDEYCADKVAGAGSTLYYAFLFLSREERRAAIAMHAFAREVQDIVDKCSDLGLARTRLAWWRQQIHTAYGGLPQHPVARALKETVAIYRLKEERFHEMMDGVAADLGQNRYASFESLADYCQRTTGTVSALCAEVFGYADRATVACARDIGVAIHLTRIIRDVRKERGTRPHLPARR